MRLVGVLVALVLAASTAYADRPPFEVVRVLPETEQVLIYDRPNNTHVLLRPGSVLGDYSIVEINGIGVIVEKQQQQQIGQPQQPTVRLAMYPRGAQDIVLNLHHDDTPEVIGKNPVVPAIPAIAPAPTIATVPQKASVAVELASLLTDPAPRRTTRAGATAAPRGPMLGP